SELTRASTTNNWTANFTPTANVEAASNTVRVKLTGVTDTAGNVGVGQVVSTNYAIDTRPPGATITLDKSSLRVGETATVTFAFSEDVGTSFSSDDVEVDNGTLGALTRTASTNSWTAPFTPTADVEDASNTIRVKLTGVTDTAGNAGVGQAASTNYVVDTRAPVFASATVNGA
ncbi:glycosyl hydrolase, partial [Verminephrobacter aporrectodeae subsp. tuberculatae]